MERQPIFLGSFEHRIPKVHMRRHANIIDITKKLKKGQTKNGVHLTPIILVDIVETDFRCNEATRFARYIQAFHRSGHVFKENHTVAMVNRTYSMIEFFVGETRINNSIILDTRKWRIIGGNETWDDGNIQYYAAQCGFELVTPSQKTIRDVMWLLEVA